MLHEDCKVVVMNIEELASNSEYLARVAREEAPLWNPPILTYVFDQQFKTLLELRPTDAEFVSLVAKMQGAHRDLTDRTRALADAIHAKRKADEAAARAALAKAADDAYALAKAGLLRCGAPLRLGLSAAFIQAAVRANFPDFRRCYEQALARAPTMQGMVAVRFIIGRDGRVLDAYDPDAPEAAPSAAPPAPVPNPPPDATMRACVIQQMKKIRFPPPRGGVLTVTYPFQFSPPP